MVSPRLKKHVNVLVYSQKNKTGCIRNHIIDKADDSLIECLCKCFYNMLKANVPLTRKQKDQLKRNKAGLRALVKKSVPLKKKKTILQKGGFLGSLLAPIAFVVAPLLSTIHLTMKPLELMNQGGQLPRPKPPIEQRVKVMDTLDKKMQTILDREDIPTDQRLKLYYQSLYIDI